MNEFIPLVGLAVPDRLTHKALLFHRTDHAQWQLPGGRIEGRDGYDPVLAAIRHGREELGFELTEEKLRFLANVSFEQWGKSYQCTVYEAKELVDLAVNADPLHYDDMALHDLYSPRVRRPAYSANVVAFSSLLVARECDLLE